MTQDRDIQKLRRLIAETQEVAARILRRCENGAGAPDTRASIACIQDAVASAHNLPRSVMTSRTRTVMYVVPRQIAMFLCRELTSHSSATIGHAFHKDHGTVFWSVKIITDRMGTEPAFAAHVESLRVQCAAKLANLNMPLFAK